MKKIIAIMMGCLFLLAGCAADGADTEAYELEEIMLENVACDFTDDEMTLAYMEEGAVGAMCITGRVLGPANVHDVLIATWANDVSEWPMSRIADEAEFYAQMWKDENVPIFWEGAFPYEICLFMPVCEEELGTSTEILLIGIDENYNPVGYAIVEGEILQG